MEPSGTKQTTWRSMQPGARKPCRYLLLDGSLLGPGSELYGRVFVVRELCGVEMSSFLEL
jgi:hypothetical protein